MAYNDLREWIAALDRAGELKRIKTEVDPVLEIAEITDRVSKGRDGKGNRWSTVGVSENIVDASFEALTDSIVYKLYRDRAVI